MSSVSSVNKKSDRRKARVLVLMLLVARCADSFCKSLRRAKRCARWSYCDQGRGGAQASGDHETGRRAFCHFVAATVCFLFFPSSFCDLKIVELQHVTKAHGFTITIFTAQQLFTTFNNFQQLPQQCFKQGTHQHIVIHQTSEVADYDPKRHPEKSLRPRAYDKR